ncbi:NADH-quinone oxidoreductase subunit L, partial [Mammaliicoccus sciuri]|nr:NADH-quinone oxidoreductase subunit L [Mammaliicoccus sciuri]
MTGLLVLFFISIGLALISSIIYLAPKVAKTYINVHLVIAFIPVLIALIGLCMTSGNVYIGFW